MWAVMLGEETLAEFEKVQDAADYALDEIADGAEGPFIRWIEEV